MRDPRRLSVFLPIAALAALQATPGISALAAGATTHLLGHASSLTQYRGQPPAGVLYKITIRAQEDGNPASLVVPDNPHFLTRSLHVGRDGGALTDTLTAGLWSGLGNPAGSKGWRYVNRDAPVGGPVKRLSITGKSLKILAKSVGSMPAPAAPNGAVETILLLGDDIYCTEAAVPHDREIDAVKVKSRHQLPPPACPPCLPGADLDGDRIEDCHETNTGVFVDLTDTGTDPRRADTDRDGLPDGDELLGTTAGLDLPGMGTNPLRKDILLEYDWFDDTLDCGPHSHRPTPASLALLTAAFAAAPVTNPDGSTGIHVVHDYGQGGLFDGGNWIADGDGVIAGDVNGAEFPAYKTANFAANRNRYFHYVILPHHYNTNSYSSGFAELLGDDMVVSLYCANSDQNVANTIMHELGHNLGLLHGGGDFCNYKPNYNSVMNYRYQFPGVDTDCDPIADGFLSYSSGDRIDLVESNLDENLGTCGSVPWDWNGNHVIESGVSVDVNFMDPDQAFVCGGILSTLHDWDDWGHLNFVGLSDYDGAPALPMRTIECLNPAPPFEGPRTGP